MLTDIAPQSLALSRRPPRRVEKPDSATEDVSQPIPPGLPKPSRRDRQERGRGIGRYIDTGATASPPPLSERASQPRGWAADLAFVEAWGACTDPMRRRSNNREKTWAAWKRAAVMAGGGQVLIQALRRYLREDPDVQRTGGPGFHVWLSDGAWEHWLPTAPITDGGALPDERWRIAVRLFQAGDNWPDTYGPAPGQPGCVVPIHLLRDACVSVAALR